MLLHLGYLGYFGPFTVKIALNSKEEEYFKKFAQNLRNVIEQVGLD